MTPPTRCIALASSKLFSIITRKTKLRAKFYERKKIFSKFSQEYDILRTLGCFESFLYTIIQLIFHIIQLILLMYVLYIDEHVCFIY